jgi:hypothetical protein
MGMNELFKAAVAGAKVHKPEIMIGFGLASGAGAIFMAIKETPVCMDAFEKAEEEMPEIPQVNEDGSADVVKLELDWQTKLLIYAKHYWPTAALELISLICIIYGSKIRLDGYTALAALYGATKVELDDIKQVISEQPENWKKKFDEKRAESHIDKSNPEDIPAPSMSNTEVPMPNPLFWDDQAMVYFRMSEEELRDAVAEITHLIGTDPFQATTMNDWMRILDHEEVQHGDYYIFSAEDNLEPLKYKQIGVKEAPNGEPARSMKFNRDYHLDTRGLYPNV